MLRRCGTARRSWVASRQEGPRVAGNPKVIDISAVLRAKIFCEDVPAADLLDRPLTVEAEFAPGAWRKKTSDFHHGLLGLRCVDVQIWRHIHIPGVAADWTVIRQLPDWTLRHTKRHAPGRFA